MTSNSTRKPNTIRPLRRAALCHRHRSKGAELYTICTLVLLAVAMGVGFTI